MESLSSLSWFSGQKNRLHKKMTPAGKMAPTGLFPSEPRKDEVQWLQNLALCPMSSRMDVMAGPDFICRLTSPPIQMQQGIGPQIQAPCSIQNLSRFGSLQKFGILLQPKLGPLLSRPHQLVIPCLLHTTEDGTSYPPKLAIFLSEGPNCQKAGFLGFPLLGPCCTPERAPTEPAALLSPRQPFGL